MGTEAGRDPRIRKPIHNRPVDESTCVHRRPSRRSRVLGQSHWCSVWRTVHMPRASWNKVHVRNDLMESERPFERMESACGEPRIQRPVPKEWQFSLRSLLIATTAVSVVMVLGMYLVGIAFVVFGIVLIQATILLAGDWLIRPANRRLLAFVTAGSWMVAGSGLLMIDLQFAWDILFGITFNEISAGVVVLSLMAACCY